MTIAALIRIRKAERDELELLAEIGYAAWERDLLPFLKDSEAVRTHERHRIAAAVRDGIDRIMVAEAQGVAAGWCLRAARRSYIPFLFVTPVLQNNGIGTLLLRRMESMLELEGADRVQLDTLADNVRAVHFYEHQGYQILAMKPDGPPGRETQMSVRLEKRLNPFRGAIQDIE